MNAEAVVVEAADAEAEAVNTEAVYTVQYSSC